MNINTGKVACEICDYAKALEIFKPMAERGKAVAQVYLGYLNGYPLPLSLSLKRL